MKLIPRADTKENWIKNNPILHRDEIALIFTDTDIPSMVVGDGKTPATKCRNITPFAFIEVVKDKNTGRNVFYIRKSQDDYKWIKQTIKERNKNKESTE